jgi:hypothetical protein
MNVGKAKIVEVSRSQGVQGSWLYQGSYTGCVAEWLALEYP